VSAGSKQLARQPFDLARPGAGREHDGVGGHARAVSQRYAGGAAGGDQDALDRRVLA
jgi:hypothetical protein